MKVNDVIKHLPMLWKNKDMMLLLSIFVFLIVAVIFSFGRFTYAFHNAQKANTQIASMQQFLNSYEEKRMSIENAPYKPVNINDVDKVQSELLLLIKVNKLTLDEFKVLDSKKDQNARKYELAFSGSWQDTMNFLRGFHVGNTLISITQLSISPLPNNVLHTVIQYKIYTA